METKFNFKSAICTSREQSEKLLALGLKKETADMALHFSYVDCEGNAYYSAYPIGHQCTAIPAWSLHRLIEMALQDILLCGISFVYAEDAYEKIIRIIESSIKDGRFRKEYLVDQAEIEEHCKGVLEYLDYIREEEMMKDDLKKRKL